MAIQFSVAVRNALLDAIETAAGAAAVLQVVTGAVPATCAASDPGTVLASLSLPSNWMNSASGGTKTLQGAWQNSAGTGGTAGHFRIYDSSLTTCHLQGTVTATGGGGDLTLDSASIVLGQIVQITLFTLTAANP